MMTAAARKAFRESFDTRHECSLCGVVEIDPALPAKDRRRMAEAARSAHYARVSHKRAVMRGRTEKAAAAEAEVDAELRCLDDAI